MLILCKPERRLFFLKGCFSFCFWCGRRQMEFHMHQVWKFCLTYTSFFANMYSSVHEEKSEAPLRPFGHGQLLSLVKSGWMSYRLLVILVAWLQAALVYQAVDHFGLVLRRPSQQLQPVIDGLAQNGHWWPSDDDADDLSRGGHVFTLVCWLFVCRIV